MENHDQPNPDKDKPLVSSFLLLFLLLELVAAFCFCAGGAVGSVRPSAITGRTSVPWPVAVLRSVFGEEGAANFFFYPGAALAAAGLVCAAIGFCRQFFSKDFRRPPKQG
jgi:hypothetical protein